MEFPDEQQEARDAHKKQGDTYTAWSTWDNVTTGEIPTVEESHRRMKDRIFYDLTEIWKLRHDDEFANFQTKMAGKNIGEILVEALHEEMGINNAESDKSPWESKEEHEEKLSALLKMKEAELEKNLGKYMKEESRLKRREETILNNEVQILKKNKNKGNNAEPDPER